MEKIDLNCYARKEIYEFFKDIKNPYYLVSFTIDVNPLYHYVKKKNLSFYYALIYCVNEAINDVDAFHFVLRNQELYHIDRREPSFTDLKKNEENFYIVTMKNEPTLDEFCIAAKKKSQKQNHFIDMEEETEDLIYYSCLPWLETAVITNEHGEDSNDCIPRVNWGKYTEDKKLTISIEVNHKVIDGVHLGLFGQKLQERINGYR